MFREAVFTLAGTVIGAGIFALPYFVARLGLGAALALLAAAILVNVWLSLAYLRVFLDTGAASLEDSAERLMGRAGLLAAHAVKMLTVTLVMYIYVSGVSSMLTSLLRGVGIHAPPEWLTRLAVAASTALIVAARPSGYARLVSSMTEWLVALMLLVSVASLLSPRGACGTPAPSYSLLAAWGPALFSSMDALTMPNIYHILGDEASTRRAVVGAYGLVAIVYAFFMASVLYALDSRVADIVVKSLYCLAPLGSRLLGYALYTIGSIVVLLAMLTSLYNFGYLAGFTLEERWGLSRRGASLATLALLAPSALLPRSFALVMHVLSTIAMTLMVSLIIVLHVAAEARRGRLNAAKLLADALILASVAAGASTLLSPRR